MKSPGAPLACVLGEIDLVRTLGLAGIRSAVVSPRGDFTRYSRFTKVAIDPLDDGRRPEALVERLLAFAQSRPEPPVLYYDADSSLLVVSRFRNELAGAFRFVIPDADLVEDVVDKARFAALAAGRGLPVPRTMLASDLDAGAHELRYPVIVKPLTRDHETWKSVAAAKVVQADDAGTLASLMRRVSAGGIDALVQEAIPGPESLIETYHAYVDEAGTVVGEFTGKKIRTYPALYGYSTALVTTDAPDVAELGREILRRVALRGVAKLDFKRHPEDGRLFLLEINPRFNLWHHLGAEAGVNLPELVYRDLVGAPRLAVGTARAGVRWCSVWRDVVAARAEGIPLRRWIPWAISCEAKRAIAWDDPLPFFAASAYRAFH